MGKGAGDVLGTVGQVASIASPIAGIGFGVANMISGAKQSNAAKKALEQYERQKLENVAEGLQVSTLGSDLQREEQARLASSQVASAREGGARTMIGSLGRIQQGNQLVNRQIGADLDMQQKAIDQMIAEDNARIRAIQENREIADISALSSQVNTGEQVKANGISQGIQGLSMLGSTLERQSDGSATNDGGEYSTSGTPIGFVNETFQSPSTERMNANYQLDSYGQPSAYVNPFSIRNPYQATKR